MKVNSKIKLVLTVVILAALTACSGSNIDVSTRFSNTQGIKEGTAVYFEEAIVGEVSDVTHKQQAIELVLHHILTHVCVS